MLLTDPALQYWSCVVAILATIAVLMLWNKVHGPRVVKGLSRAGLLLGGYLATAVAVLVSVNIAYGGLIVSVSDLFAEVNPPMGQFMHGGCGHGHGHGHEMEAGATSEASDSAGTAAKAAAKEPAGQAYDDAQAPPPGVDPALGGGGGKYAGFGPSCGASASAGPSAVATSTATATAAAAEAHALK